MRPIDANALIKDIAESIHLADEWEKESYEKKDEIGLKCAIDTRRSLLAMISRVKEAPTIEAKPVQHGQWYEFQCFSEHGIPMASYECTNCGNDIERQRGVLPAYCEFCGAKMDVIDTNVGDKESTNNDSFKNGG